jgi:TP901 family phage tail tape measure protein
MGDITGASLDRLKQQALDLGAATQFSAKEAADGMGAFASAGFTADQIYAAMPGTLDLAAAGQLNVGRAAEIAKDILGQFGLEAQSSGHLADVLAQAGADASGSLEDMANSLKYAGPFAAQLGMSVEETTAALIGLDQAGIRGEQAGTSLRGVFASIVAPSSDAAKVLSDLGVSITDTSGKMLPFSQVMEQLKGKLPTSEVDRAAAIFTIFGRQAGSAAQILIDTGAPALDAMTARLVESTGAAERQATTLNQGLGGAFERMKGSIETAGIALGTALAPVAEKVAGFIETLADKAGALASWFGTLPEPVQTIVIGLAGLVAAVGPLLIAFGSVASAIGSISAVIPIITSALSTVAAAFSWPVIAIAAVTAALVALGVWVYTNWDSIVAVVSQAWDGITELWGAIWDHITAYLGPIWDGIRSAAQTVFGWFAPFFTYLWDSVKSAFTTAWDGIKDFLSSVWNSIKSVAESVWGAITGAFKSFLEWAEKIPGVNKLLSLDEAWNSAKKLGEQTDKNTKSLKDNADATTKDSEEVAALKAKIKELLEQLDKANKSHKDGAKAVTDQIKPTKQLSTEMKILSEMIQIRVKRQNEAIRKIAEERVAQEDGTVATEDYAAGFAKLNQALMESMAQHKNLASSIPPVISQMAQLSGPVDAYYEALDRAGIKSTETYNRIAADAQATYDAIANDPRATQWEQDNAMLRLLRAQADAARASGTEISAAQQQTLGACLSIQLVGTNRT